jgi:ABC-2 type transport system permease protein
MLRRILALSIKEFIHLRKDWWLPAFMLFGGAMELLLVGWATSRPITNLPMMVLDYDRGPESRAFIIAVENSGTLALDSYAPSLQAMEQALVRDKINAGVIVPPGFSDAVRSDSGQPEISVLLNGAQSAPARAALRAIEGVARDRGEAITIRRLGLNRDLFAGFNPSLRVWFNEALSEALYTTPAELGLMLEFTVLLFAALSFSREREFGTLEQLLVMPFSALEIIVGKSIPVIMVGFFDFLLMLAMTHFAFGVPVRGSMALLLALALGYVLVELSKGLVISVISKTQHQAFLLVMLVGMADFMFTGYAAPVESMPRALQLLANIVPAHHWLVILRGILLKASGVRELWFHILALAVLGIVITSASMRFVRRALD